MCANDSLASHLPAITDTSALATGDRVSIHHPRGLHYPATVEERMSALNVVWVRELSTGERKMVSTDEHTILRH